MKAAENLLDPIELQGSVRRTFIFPAPLTEAFEYYSDLPRAFRYLPHIRFIKKFPSGCLRLQYQTIELGVYQVNIFCDILSDIQHDRYQLTLFPCNNEKPIHHHAGMHSLTSMGSYRSVSLFEPLKEQTVIHYQLELIASLPAPRGLALVPSPVRNRFAAGITRLRIDEIADKFMYRSIAAYFDDLGNQS